MPDINKLKKDYYFYYHNVVKPKLSKYEEKRVKKLRLFYILLPFLIILPLILGIFGVYLFFLCDKKDTLELIIFGFSGIFFLPIFVYNYFFKKPFEKEIKNSVMKTVLEPFETFKWSQKESITQQQIQYSLLFKMFNCYSVDDNFIGSYKDINVSISEPFLQYVSGSGKNRHCHTVFDGVLIQFSMNKTFKSQTVILKDALFQNSRNMGKVELEDLEFNKMFDVFSQDQVEARYLITTSFMERFKELKNIFKGKDISASFFNNSIMIAIATNKDFFSLGSLTVPINDGGQIQQFVEELISILSIVDTLKLNTNLGL